MRLQDDTEKWNDDLNDNKGVQGNDYSNAYERGLEDDISSNERYREHNWNDRQRDGSNRSDDDRTEWISKPQIEDSETDNEEV